MVNSSSVNLPGLFSTSSGTIIFPTSCKNAPTANCRTTGFSILRKRAKIVIKIETDTECSNKY